MEGGPAQPTRKKRKKEEEMTSEKAKGKKKEEGNHVDCLIHVMPDRLWVLHSIIWRKQVYQHPYIQQKERERAGRKPETTVQWRMRAGLKDETELAVGGDIFITIDVCIYTYSYNS